MHHETPDFLTLFANVPVPVIPVLVIEHADDAVPIAQALVAGGLRILEITLRTSDALAAVSLIRNSIPEAIVGVGSVIDVKQFGAAVEAGALFAVSPGMTAKLAAGAASSRLPWLPGAQTVSEVLALREQGYRMVKLFPSHSAGGINFLRAIMGPVPDMKFCPTGGVSATVARDYLALPNVACVGGSWLTTPSLIAERRWEDIQILAKEASSLAGNL
jgi:2-dehydro-3-deoxyphosphogluconate aldolase/(4S)-4-hydroxy-2-oxoglutarate aldolase